MIKRLIEVICWKDFTFLLDIFYKRVTNKQVKLFIKSYVVIHSSSKDRHFERTCNTPYFKWYIKRYFKKYKKKSTKSIKKTEVET